VLDLRCPSLIYMKKSLALPEEAIALRIEVKQKNVSELLARPQYSRLAWEVHKRCGSMSRFHHIAVWPVSHWWQMQDWINQQQSDLEEMFGPVVRLVSTQKQVHGGKVYLLAFFEIGPISPICSPLKVGSAWRNFIAAIED
jgi:hypothetical protein